jgi:hypothetical protein
MSMSATRLASFAALTLVTATAGTASAQVVAGGGGPPGACACEAPVVSVTPVAAAQPALRKWGVGLRMTSLTVAPEGSESADDQVSYGGGGFQLRYRIRPHWGLELAMDHVTEHHEDGTEGTRSLDSVSLSASYHFRPYSKWDWYVLLGFGGVADGNPDLTDEQREETAMGAGHIGAGVERRFNRFAIGAELRAVGMSPAEDDEVEDAPVRPGAPAMTVPAREEQKLSGGQLSIAATYYF